jgi:hypothetical protein
LRGRKVFVMLFPWFFFWALFPVSRLFPLFSFRL